MASCVEHGEWEMKFLACPKCFKDGDVRQPMSYPPDRQFVDSLAIKPIDAWTGQEKMRLHNIATRATQSARPEVLCSGWIQVSERMPTPSFDQLLNIAYRSSEGVECVAIGTFNDDGWSYDFMEDDENVEAWIPVPSIPSPLRRSQEKP